MNSSLERLNGSERKVDPDRIDALPRFQVVADALLVQAAGEYEPGVQGGEGDAGAGGGVLGELLDRRGRVAVPEDDGAGVGAGGEAGGAVGAGEKEEQ